MGLISGMQFRPIPAAEALRLYIRNYWILEFRALEPGGTQRIMTNGASCMMYLVGKETLTLYGPSMHNISIDFTEGEHVMLGVEFHPAGVHAFFRESTVTLVDNQLEAEELGADFEAYRQQLVEMKNLEDYAGLADAFFLSRLALVGRTNKVNMTRMMNVFAYIETHHPAVIKIADLAAIACVCPRQFNRIFTEYVGLTPKEYLRIYRFHATLLALREHPEHTTMMQLAWDNGYYDLKHMNADFRDICAHMPKSEEISQRLTETFGQSFSLLMKKKILPINVV